MNRYHFIFGNCAGAARGEKCNPKQLGKFLKKQTHTESSGQLVAVGLSEVIISTAGLPRSRWLEQPVFSIPLLPGKETKNLDDLKDFKKGYLGSNREKADPGTLYLSHLNSRDHNHPEAVENKWNGVRASERIVRQYQSGHDVFQGTGAILFKDCHYQQAVQLRPSGLEPDWNSETDCPSLYRGNRNSEPRAAVIIRKIQLTANLTVDLAFCQLETNSQDLRIGTTAQLDQSSGGNSRTKQIQRLCDALENGNGEKRPMILMGDFNCRPGQKEFQLLVEQYGFHFIPPEGTPEDLEPDHTLSEKKQHLPFSHLNHGILIDHAFVKGFDSDKWRFRSNILELPNENKLTRISDHRPVMLTLDYLS